MTIDILYTKECGDCCAARMNLSLGFLAHLGKGLVDSVECLVQEVRNFQIW